MPSNLRALDETFLTPEAALAGGDLLAKRWLDQAILVAGEDGGANIGTTARHDVTSAAGSPTDLRP